MANPKVFHPPMFTEIPLQRPTTPLLDQISIPADLRAMSVEQLPEIASQLREFLLYSVGQSGGHFGAGLGVVELTLALHYVFNTPDDRLVWDVGHQTYPHKILTGRRDQMHTMRQGGGLAGFPKRAESEFDTFGVGHSSTSISAALGMALAAKAQGIDRKAVAVIGDGAMTAGMAFEGLAHAAHCRANMLVVLNDNQMSIGHNSGGLNNYFSRLWASRTYTGLREEGKKVLARIPPAWELARKVEEHMKGMVSDATIFEELGFNYIGPIDGHDTDALVHYLTNLRDLDGPQFLHILTQKGKGFVPAEADPIGYHAITKIEPKKTQPSTEASKPKGPKYQQVFGDWLCDMAEQDSKVIGITPAMCEGSGMVDFSARFPDRYHDVAIAEQHAVTLAAGMACDGLKPVVAIYSTFLQRAYDQLVHDVAIQNLDVTFGIDRAGLVGEDGPTHAGAFDISYLRCIPNMVIAAPSDENETRQLLYTCYQHQGPAAVRYPRGTGPGSEIKQEMSALPIGKSVLKKQGSGIAILNFGTLLPAAMAAAEKLNATVVDMRFVKPLDEQMVLSLLDKHSMLVTLEENAIMGGAGAAVSEFLNTQGLTVSVVNLGLPDRYVEHDSHSAMLASVGLDESGIYDAIVARLPELKAARVS